MLFTGKNLKLLLLIILPALFPALLPAQGIEQSDTAVPGEARIVVQKEDSLWQIRAVFRNTDRMSAVISYKLTAERQGSSGTSSTNQSGETKIEAGKQKVLSTVKINVGAGDQYEFRLETFRDGRLVSADSLSSGNKTDTDKKQY